MTDTSLIHLAEEAAAGLQGDAELYTAVTRDLCATLDATTAALVQQGHSDADSAEMARQAFGAPAEVGAGVMAAHTGRMRRRKWARLCVMGFLIPLALVLALYLGYGRLAQAQALWFVLNRDMPFKLPLLPGMNADKTDPNNSIPALRSWKCGSEHVDDLRRYWEAHRGDPDERIYYAYYADNSYRGFPQLVDIMRQGERIDPHNAYYPLTLSAAYLSDSLYSIDESSSTIPPLADDLRDRGRFTLGMAEFRTAMSKPFLRSYRMEITRKKLAMLPPARGTEDYLAQMTLLGEESFHTLAFFRNWARKLPGCARQLLADGDRAQAEAVMDSWKPLTRFLTDDAVGLLAPVVAGAVGARLTTQGADLYHKLGAFDKEREARAAYPRFVRILNEWKLHEIREARNSLLCRHAGFLTRWGYTMLFGTKPTAEELIPGRMYEHALVERGVSSVLQMLCILAMLALLLAGGVGVIRLRHSSEKPMLLLPPAGEWLRMVLLGLVLPVVVYRVYSRLPGIGGREYNWATGWPRFGAELFVLACLLLWLPVHFISRKLRRRCAELGIEASSGRDAWAMGFHLAAQSVIALMLALGAFVFAFRDIQNVMASQYNAMMMQVRAGQPTQEIPFLKALFLFSHPATLIISAAGLLLAVGLLGWIIAGHRRGHLRCFSTMALSLAPVYACLILFLALAVQPWLVRQENSWLQKDTTVFNFPNQLRDPDAGYTSVEVRTTARGRAAVNAVLEGKDPGRWGETER